MMNFSTTTSILGALCVLLLTTTTLALNENLPFPGFRYVPWNLLSVERQGLATTAGWTEATWNQPGNATVEALSFDSLPSAEATQAMTSLGFSEGQYDCFVNHYAYYDWDELLEEEVAVYLVQLGWNNDSWTGVAPAPDSENKLWAELTAAEQTAAGMICYFQGIWDEEDLTTMTVPVVYPDMRYQIWNQLTAEEQTLATTADWTETSWNNVGTADLEDSAFSSLTMEQQVALTSLGFYEDQYDCYMNHYEDYFWAELQLYELVDYYETLGWTQESWEGNATAPASEEKDWSELTTDEQAAAEELCFFQENWDEVPLANWGSTGVSLCGVSLTLLVAFGVSFFVM